MLPYQTTPRAGDKIAIAGIGGAGVNILQYFGGSSAENVALYAMAADPRLGRDCGNVRFVRLGGEEAPFTATGGRPEAGRGAMERSRAFMQEMLSGIRVLVMVAGLGGGTGSGAAPLLAEWAHRAGVYVVSVAIMPFRFEGAPRRARAQQALVALQEWSDICLCFENDQMAELQDAQDGAQAAFDQANRILAQSVAAVPWIANAPGLVNLGLDDLAAAMCGRAGNRAVFGFGRGYGEDRVDEAVRTLMESPLLAHHLAHGGISGPVLLHVAGGEDLTLSEIEAVADAVQRQMTAYGQELLFGTSVKPALQQELRVTLIASVPAPAPAPEAVEPEPEPEPEMKPEPEEVEEPVPAPPVEDDEVDSRVQSMFSEMDNATHEPPPESEPEPEAAEPEPEPEPAPEPEPEPAEETPAPEPEPAPAEKTLPDFARPESQSLFDFDEPPAPKAPQRRRTARSIAAAETDEVDSRVRDIFAEIDNAPEGTPRDTRAYSPDTRSRATKGDDIDTPPSLRFNDLSNLFPD
ncbi:MAG: hypothetical protein MJ056_07385 [Akkermansia sp.]|nr:hypothetical protein [Akkermansia sp.]